MHTVCIIPARYASERFPGKPLALLEGKPLIQWVWERASASRLIRQVYVATDDERIFQAVEEFGGDAVLTSPHHPSGSDRIGEVVKHLEAELIVNLQGDEPMMQTEVIDAAIRALQQDPSAQIATPMVAIKDAEEFHRPDVVKVVCDLQGYALYFSRSAVPNRTRSRHSPSDPWGYKHLGLYVYRRDALESFLQFEPSPLEQAEKLEQLRLLEHGFRIKVVRVAYDSVGVDTPEDLEYVRKLLTSSD